MCEPSPSALKNNDEVKVSSTGSPLYGCSLQIRGTAALWDITQWSHLTRNNKLTSPAFFLSFSPDGSSAHILSAERPTSSAYEFRVGLFKGLVPAEKEEDDSIGFVLEWVPPEAPTASPSAIAEPGVTSLSVTVYARREAESNLEDGEKLVSDSLIAPLSLSEKHVVLPALIPSYVWESPIFTAERASPLTLRVAIVVDYGIKAVLYPIAETVTSAWSSFSSRFSQWSQLVTPASFSSVPVSDILQRLESLVPTVPIVPDYLFSKTAGQSAAVPNVVASSSALHSPWSCTPARWLDKEDYWNETLHRLLSDPQTFLRGPSEIEDDLRNNEGVEEEVLEGLGLSFDALKKLYRAPETFTLHDGLHIPPIQQMFSQLVPSRISAPEFFANAVWKTACIASCGIEGEVKAILLVLNHPLNTYLPRDNQKQIPPSCAKQDALKGEGVEGDKPPMETGEEMLLQASSPAPCVYVEGGGSSHPDTTSNRKLEGSQGGGNDETSPEPHEESPAALPAVKTQFERQIDDSVDVKHCEPSSTPLLDIDFPRMPWEEEGGEME